MLNGATTKHSDVAVQFAHAHRCFVFNAVFNNILTTFWFHRTAIALPQQINLTTHAQNVLLWYLGIFNGHRVVQHTCLSVCNCGVKTEIIRQTFLCGEDKQKGWNIGFVSVRLTHLCYIIHFQRIYSHRGVFCFFFNQCLHKEAFTSSPS